MNQRAAIYARFSSDNQTESSITAQVQICKSYCQRKKYSVVKIYTDEAKSGTTTAKRDSYKRMLSDAKADLYDVIIFHKIDRNARNEYDYYQFKNKIVSLGKGYEYAGQNVDNTPEGQLMENNLVGFAAYFSRNLSKEVKKGQMVKAERAMFLGGQPPLGYTIVNQQYVVDENEACAVKIIFNMYNDGYGYSSIIKVLNKQGYKTKRGNAFGKNSLHDILCNERYKGVYFFGRRPKVNGKANSHAWKRTAFRQENALPRIISEDVFELAQAKMAKRRHAPGTFSAKNNYILTGLVVDEYGNKMCGHTSSVRGKYRYSNYMVSSNRLKCNPLKISQKELEDEVLSIVVSKFTPEFVDNVLTRASEILSQKSDDPEKELQILITKKQSAEKRLNHLYSFIENNGDDFDFARLSQIKREIIELDTLIAKKSKKSPSIPLQELRKYWINLIGSLKNESSPETLRVLLARLIRKVTVKKKEFSVTLNPFVGLEGSSLALPTSQIL